MRWKQLFLATVAPLLISAWIPLTVVAQPLPVPELPSAQSAIVAEDGTFGAAVERDPACAERTNGCEVCARGDDGKPKCSLPGIACQPGRWRCKIGASETSEKPDPGR